MSAIATPDFPALFARTACECVVESVQPWMEHTVDCPAGINPLLTPRAALHLWVACELLEDECREALDCATSDPIPEDTPSLPHLPPAVVWRLSRV